MCAVLIIQPHKKELTNSPLSCLHLLCFLVSITIMFIGEASLTKGAVVKIPSPLSHTVSGPRLAFGCIEAVPLCRRMGPDVEEWGVPI